MADDNPGAGLSPTITEETQDAGGGAPGMSGAQQWERLWTPHRMQYIRGENRPQGEGEGPVCPFCRVPELPEPESLIVRRGEVAYVVMNLYPYNSGHLLVCPYRHVADYTELTGPEVLEVAELTRASMTALRAAAGAQGFNIGMNQGAISGAGIAAHLHQHVVPRWRGDANFMPVVGGTKTMPMLLEETRDLIAEHWPATDTG
ncbi:MAG: adenylyltransferase [Actinomycetota bacterium]|jgi:ATP adenylyltransferase|nr:adenylyltransferase [Actinomycetota bacterium]